MTKAREEIKKKTKRRLIESIENRTQQLTNHLVGYVDALDVVVENEAEEEGSRKVGRSFKVGTTSAFSRTRKAQKKSIRGKSRGARSGARSRLGPTMRCG